MRTVPETETKREVRRKEMGQEWDGGTVPPFQGKKDMRRYAVMGIVIGLLAVLVPFAAGAIVEEQSGTCGTNAQYTVEADGTLRIFGTGAVSSTPWKGCGATRVIFEDGITSIGSSTFLYDDLNLVESISIGKDISDLGGLTGGSFGSPFDAHSPEYLQSISVSEENNLFTSLDGALYNKEFSKLLRYPVKSQSIVTVPETVRSIAASAFSGCVDIEKVVLPSGILKLESYTFYHCSNLKEINLPQGLQSIGSRTFAGCSLEELTIPSSVRIIGSGAFHSAFSPALSEIIIPENVQTIENSVFAGNRIMSSVSILGYSTTIGTNAFFNSDLELRVPKGSVAEQYAIENQIPYVQINDFSYLVNNSEITITGYLGSKTDVVIPEAIEGSPVKRICAHAFSNLEGQRTVFVPECVALIDATAFEGCGQLTLLGYKNTAVSAFAEERGIPFTLLKNIVDSGVFGHDGKWTLESDGLLTVSGTGALKSSFYRQDIIRVVIEEGITTSGIFHYCNNLKEVYLPEGLETIEQSAFSGCSNLEKVELPDGLTKIDSFAFNNCKALKSIRIPGSLKECGENVIFSGCSGLTSVIIEDGAIIRKGLFAQLGGLTTVSIKGDMSSWGSQAFYKCTALTTVSLSEGLKSIPDSTFSSCSSLTEINLPDSVEKIGEFAFYGTGITEVLLPDSIEEIGELAFYGTGITEVLLPDHVRFMDGTFDYTVKYITSRFGQTAKMLGVLPNSYGTICSRSFQDPDYPGIDLIYDTEENLQVYGIDESITKAVIPEGVTGFYNYISALKNVKELTLPGSMGSVTIRSYSSSEPGVQKLTLSEGITSIGMDAFQGWSSLTEVTLPETLETIENGAFWNSGITSIVIPGSVTRINGHPFPMNCHMIFGKCNEIISSWVSGYLSSVSNHSTFDYYYVFEINHTDIMEDPRTEPTCSAFGYEAGSHCAHCGMILTAQKQIPKLAHTPVTDPAVPPTERESGLTEGSHCAVCGEVLVAQEVILPSWDLWEYEVRDGEAVIKKYLGTEKNVMVPASLYDIPVSEIAANAFQTGHCPERIYIPKQIQMIDSNAFAAAPIVYCSKFSEAEYAAHEKGYSTVFTDNVTGGTFYLVEILQKDFRLLRHDTAMIEVSYWPKLDGVAVKWSSSSNSRATVEDGTVTGMLPGNVTISASVGSVSKSVTVTVYGPPDIFSLSQETVDLTLYSTYQLSVRDIYPAGSDLEITWSSSSTRIATVNENGLISAHRPGTAVVTATGQNGISRSANITVYYPVEAIEFDFEYYEIPRDSSLKLQTRVITNSETFINRFITFSSSNSNIASVNQNGLVIAKAIGKTIITAQASNGVQSQTEISVICPDHKQVILKRVEATCETEGKTEGSYCPTCGIWDYRQEKIPALGHDMRLTENVPADENVAGYRLYECARQCGKKEKETIPAEAAGYFLIGKTWKLFALSKGSVDIAKENWGRFSECQIVFQNNGRCTYSMLSGNEILTSGSSSWTYDQTSSQISVPGLNTLWGTGISGPTFAVSTSGYILAMMWVNKSFYPGHFSPDGGSPASPIDERYLGNWKADYIYLSDSDRRVCASNWGFLAPATIRIQEEDRKIEIDGESGTWSYSCGDFYVDGERNILKINELGRLTFRLDQYSTLVFMKEGETSQESRQQMILPKGLEVIEDEAFAGIRAQEVVIQDGCLSIGQNAFSDCHRLEAVVIPASVTEIASNAFSGCSIMIIAPQNSYALEWAKNNGFDGMAR